MSYFFNALPVLSHSARRGRATGFTMIEFTAAVVIGAIVSVLAVGSYRLYERELPVRHAARRLAHGFGAARAFAITQNTPYAVKIDRRFNNFWIDQVDTAGRTTTPKVVQPEIIDENVTLVDIQFGVTPAPAPAGDPVTVRFFPDGSSEDVRVFLRMVNAPNTPGATYTVRNYGPTGQSKVFENQQLATTTGP